MGMTQNIMQGFLNDAEGCMFQNFSQLSSVLSDCSVNFNRIVFAYTFRQMGDAQQKAQFTQQYGTQGEDDAAQILDRFIQDSPDIVNFAGHPGAVQVHQIGPCSDTKAQTCQG